MVKVTPCATLSCLFVESFLDDLSPQTLHCVFGIPNVACEAIGVPCLLSSSTGQKYLSCLVLFFSHVKDSPQPCRQVSLESDLDNGDLERSSRGRVLDII